MKEFKKLILSLIHLKVEEVGKYLLFFSYNYLGDILKDFLFIHYHLMPSDILMDSSSYQFRVKDDFYVLRKVEDSHQVVSYYQWTKGIAYYDSFILSLDGNLFSFWNGKMYVLMKKSNIPFQMNWLFHQTVLSSSILLSWKNNWIRIADTFPIMEVEGFDYYFSMLELAIDYLPKEDYYAKGFLQHINFFQSYQDPFNSKMDVLERDIGEFLKMLFWKKMYSSFDFSTFFQWNLFEINYSLVIARVLFPNYYLNCLEKKGDLSAILSRRKEYEQYVLFLIEQISSFYPIKKVCF